MRFLKLFLLSCLLTACGSPPSSELNGPSGKGGGLSYSIKQSANNIYYHGGAVMNNPIHIYFIWYGTWTSGQDILINLAENIGISPYFNINTTYMDRVGHRVSTDVTLSGQATDNYSQGSSLNDNAIKAIVKNAIDTQQLPADPDGVYFVLTSPDVTETSGFCNVYCGWHTSAAINGQDLKYAFIGNAETQCPNSCIASQNLLNSPNGNIGVDGMCSVFSHELEEAASDPDLNAWYDKNGAEDADKCAWTFGDIFPLVNGSEANMQLGALYYLIQRNWVNANGGYCALYY